MLETQIVPLRIAGSRNSLSKAQKTFNSQIQQIETLRARLAAWEAAIAAYQQRYASELAPILEAGLTLQAKLVQGLDRAIRQPGLLRRERTLLREEIVELAAEVLNERDDAEVKALYNKHSRSDYDSDEAAQLLAMKDFLEDAFDLELGEDDDLASADELMQRAQRQFQQKQAQHEAEQRARSEQRARRSASRRQGEKERRAEAEAREISQSIREVYRKLASALHPDREPDPQERARKTALMQRMNQAYDNRDLMQLLHLQLELEQIDREAIGKLDAERLRHYNAILKDQIIELNRELVRVKATFSARFGLLRLDDNRPEMVLRELSEAVLVAKLANRELEEDLLALATPKGIKAWLKKLRKRQRERDFVEIPF
jgi:hypothetical protein